MDRFKKDPRLIALALSITCVDDLKIAFAITTKYIKSQLKEFTEITRTEEEMNDIVKYSSDVVTEPQANHADFLQYLNTHWLYYVSKSIVWLDRLMSFGGTVKETMKTVDFPTPAAHDAFIKEHYQELQIKAADVLLPTFGKTWICSVFKDIEEVSLLDNIMLDNYR